MNNIQYLINIFVSIIAAVTLIYKIGFKNTRKREIKYYENVLKPIIDIIKYNEKVNITRSLKKFVKSSDDSVPKYIFYLMSQSDNQNLEKVLFFDYYDIYENDDNNITNIIKNLNKIAVYGVVLLSLVCIFYSSISFAEFLISLLGDFEKNFKFFIYEIILSTLLFVIGLFLIYLARCFNTDRYTLEINKMKKIIEKKTKWYDDKNKKIFY